MAADSLSLLFRLGVDPSGVRAGVRASVAEIRGLTAAFSREVEAIRKIAAQPFKLLTPTAPAAPKTSTRESRQTNQVDEQVKDFRRIEAAAARSARVQEREQARLTAAIANLQRQRSAAVIKNYRDEENAAGVAARAQERAARAATSARPAAGPLARTSLLDDHIKEFRQIEAAAAKSARVQEQEQARLNRAVESLQRQRSAAVIKNYRDEENSAATAARAQERAAAKATNVPKRSSLFDDHVKEFRRVEAEAIRSARAQEREQARLVGASASLQRQRSAAVIKAYRDDERAAVNAARAQERAARQASQATAQAFQSLGSGLQSAGRSLSLAVTAPLLALGAASLRAAKDIDSQLNSLKALTGSAAAAEGRLAELIATSRKTPGLTTALALQLDAQLRVAQTTEETINRVLPAIGRLNAVQRLEDPGRFAQNLLQLVTQNFERQDLKELVGQSPVAGRLITEIFNVNSPTNGKAIRESAQKLGLTSVDAFFRAFAEAAARDQGLQNITESIGTRFQKMADLVTVALRPLGLAILSAIEPYVEPVARAVERIGEAFNELPRAAQLAVIGVGALAAAAGPVLFTLGGIASGISTIAATISTLFGAGGVLAGAGTAITGAFTAAAAAVGGVVPLVLAAVAALALLAAGAYGLFKAWQTNFGGLRDTVDRTLGNLGRTFERIMTEKVLDTIGRLWETYGQRITGVLESVVRSIGAVTESIVNVVGGTLETLAKIIDGDWQGAWNAASDTLFRFLGDFDRFANELWEATKRALVLMTDAIDDGLRKGLASFDGWLKNVLAKMRGEFQSEMDRQGRILARAFDEGFFAELDRFDRDLRGLIDRVVGLFRRGNAEIARLQKQGREAEDIRRRAEAAAQAELEGSAPETGKATAAFVPEKPPSTGRGGLSGSEAEGSRKKKELDERLELLKVAEAAAERSASFETENLRRNLDARKTSLAEFTAAAIKEAEKVLEARTAALNRELELARQVAGAEGNVRRAQVLEELKAATDDYLRERARLLEEQRKAEEAAASEHRRALLEIQSQADSAEIARLEGFARQGLLTLFDVENRRAEIESKARARARESLRLELGLGADRRAEERARLESLRLLAEEEDRLAERKVQAQNLALPAPPDLEGQRRYVKDLAEITEAEEALTVRRNRLTKQAARPQLSTEAERRHLDELREIYAAEAALREEAARAAEGARKVTTAPTEAAALSERLAQIEAERKALQARADTIARTVGIENQSVEERRKILDALRLFDEESSAAVEESERRKRDALRETTEAYNDYYDAIRAAQTSAAAALREAARIEVESLRSRLGDRRRFVREIYEIERAEAEANHEESLRRIDEEERAAVRAAERAGDIERRRLEIEREFNDLRLAEQERFNAESSAQAEDQRRELDPLTVLKDRYDNFLENIRNTNDSISNSVGSLAGLLSETFDAMRDALGQSIAGFILYGNAIGQALKKALAQQLAQISAEASIMALKHAAYAIGSAAFLDFRGAAQHAAAAAAFAGLALATGLGGRSLAKSTGMYKGGGAATANAAVNGGERQPNNQQFNYGGQSVESASSAQREGSASPSVQPREDVQMMSALVERLDKIEQRNAVSNARVAEVFGRFTTKAPGVIIAEGARDAFGAIGEAVLEYSGANSDFNTTLLRNQGVV